MENQQNQQCLQCAKPMTGRWDKKFCDSQCRSNYHNQHRRKHERMITAVNRQLRKNRRILQQLCPEGKTIVRKERLEDMGFAFQYFTSIFNGGQLTYYFCYEYGYAAIMQPSRSAKKEVPKVLIIQSRHDMKGKFDPWAK